MITIAIIGILVVIASAALITFQAKSKQAEAKVNLQAIGSMALAYKAEKDTYITDFSGLGWAPTGSTRYGYYYNTSLFPGSPSITPSGGCTVPATDGAASATSTAFTSIAIGDIDRDATCDRWTYNRDRNLQNSVNDATTS
mgnify:CR=1 FL=1